MTNQMHTLPGEMNAGLDFNYAVWTANTTVTLCNVPWNSDYRDVVRFDNSVALDDYLLNQSGPATTIPGVTYARVGHPIRINMPFNNAYRYNYLRAYNPAQPIEGNDTPRAFYYFVTGVDYINPNTTQITIQLDIWQTFGYDATFGNCYIERGHIGIANQDSFSDYGREFLTIPEGLDIGGEYQIVDEWQRNIASAVQERYSIMVTSTVSLTEPPGTIDSPLLSSARGSTFENLPNGASAYLFDNLTEFRDFLFMYSSKPWITQGIISVMAIPDNDDYGIEYDTVEVNIGNAAGPVTIKELKGSLNNKFFHPMKTNWREDLNSKIPARYAHLDKLKTYPYTVLEMTSYTGTPLVIKPESWANPDAIVIEMPHFAAPGARIMFAPFRYNAAGTYTPSMLLDLFDGEGGFKDGGEFLDMATGIVNFPTFSTVNNGYMSYMAANSNTIPYQHASADWSQQRALSGSATAYDNANTGMDLSRNVNSQGISASMRQNTLANETAGFNALKGGANSIVGGVQGVAGGGGAGAMIGAGMGVANSAADYAIGVNQRNQALGIGVDLSSGVNRAQNAAALDVADSNKALAEYAAKGDYQNQIAGITAKVQDAKLIQPTTSGQIGGDAFNLAVHKWGYDVKVKMMQSAAITSIGEYWLRYGYQVNRFSTMPASFMVCEKFTYWKLRETYITAANCPETFKQALRGIFEKGVTVWKNPDDIGNIDIADNAPLEGVTL